MSRDSRVLTQEYLSGIKFSKVVAVSPQMVPVYQAIQEMHGIKLRVQSTEIATIGSKSEDPSQLNWTVYDPVSACSKKIFISPSSQAGSYTCQERSYRQEKGFLDPKMALVAQDVRSLESIEEVIGWLIRAIANSIVEVPTYAAA